MEDRETGLLHQEETAAVGSGAHAEDNDITSLTSEDEREFESVGSMTGPPEQSSNRPNQNRASEMREKKKSPPILA